MVGDSGLNVVGGSTTCAVLFVAVKDAQAPSSTGSIRRDASPFASHRLHAPIIMADCDVTIANGDLLLPSIEPEGPHPFLFQNNGAISDIAPFLSITSA